MNAKENLWRQAANDLLLPLLKSKKVGLVTDVDGTISPIVDRPEAATVTPRAKALLTQLVDHLPLVAVISGRAAQDVQARVGVPGVVYIGNHGLEQWENGRLHPLLPVEPYRPALLAAKTAVESSQPPAGLWVEDKGATLSIHYRQTADPDQVAATYAPLLEEIAAAQQLHLFQGRLIFELRPPLEANKGTAFAQLIKTHGLEAAVFLGDDTTDADALRMAQTLRTSGQCHAVGVGVLSADTPTAVLETADCFASGIPDVEDFFAWLFNTRIASTT